MRFGKCTVDGCPLTHDTRWAGFLSKKNRACRSASRGSSGSKGKCKKGGKAKSNNSKGKKGKEGGKDRSRSRSRDSKDSRNKSPSRGRSASRGRGRSGSPSPRPPRVENRPERVCIFYNHGKCNKSAKDCPLVHNPTCKFYSSSTGCRNGDKCLSPHREKGGLMALRSPLSKRKSSLEKNKVSEASSPTPKPKAKAKVKVKAKAKSTAKVPGTVLLLKKIDETQEASDATQSP